MSKSKRSKKQDKRYMGEGNIVFHMDSVEATLAKMPRIDGYVCRGGIHGDTKYNRRKEKAKFRKMLASEW